MLTSRLLVLLAFLLVLAAPAHAAAGWAPTAGAMSEPRWLHQAALLGNGKVLVAGGYSTLRPTEVLASAELYNPASGTFTPAAPMITPRSQFAMAKLADGRVLAVGGVTGQYGAGVVANAEVYDPATNRWSGVEGLHYARYGFTLVGLPGGRLLAVGGLTASNGTTTPVRPTEIFEPGRDTWTMAGDTTSPRDGSVAAPLPDGRVVVGGGYDTNVQTAASELFTGTGWAAGNPMNYPRQLGAISVLADGRPFTTGGYSVNANYFAPTSEFFAGGQWRYAPAPAEGRAKHTQTTLTSGRVLITGGQGRGNSLASAEVYDPATNAWSSAGAMNTVRQSHTASLLADGRVLVTGGVPSSSPLGTTTAEVYTAPTSMSVVSALALGSRKLGAGSGAALQVTNTGDSPLFVSAAGIGGINASDFGANAARCQGVAAGATCTVDVGITPSGPGAREAVLTLSANTSPATVAVNLSGVGVADTDGDGITDDIDRCGRQKGTAARQGCPAGLLADPSIRYRAAKRSIRVLAYYVKATKGARVTVTCSKQACKKTVTKGKGAKQRIRITRLNGRRLKNGTKITVTASLKGRLTTTVVDRVSKGRRIEGRPRCAPVACDA